MLAQLQSTALTLGVFFILLFVYTKLAGPIPFSVNSITTTKSDSFQVSGEGRVTITPDMALLNVGVSASGTSVKNVQDQINANINRVSDSIKGLGVAPEDIQTLNYSVNPTYDFSGSSQRINGYTANTTLSIKIRDLTNANQVIDAATSSGANQLGGLSFESSNKTKAEEEARQKAVESAKAKAQSAARIAGFSLGKLINYQESFSGVTPPIPMRSIAVGSADEKSTQIEPGANEVVVNVILSYEVR